MRMCVDYRTLNSNIVEDSFPIPLMNDLLNELYGDKYISKLDLRSNYHHNHVHPDGVAKTIFCTPKGHYKFLAL